MDKEEALIQLRDLICDRKSFITSESDDIYIKDVEALEFAIKELTAQEVSVQEQSNKKGLLISIVLSLVGIICGIAGLII